MSSGRQGALLKETYSTGHLSHILTGPQGRMVGTLKKAKAAAPVEGTAPSTQMVADASTQMERLQCRL